jgi:hypothetical protein
MGLGIIPLREMTKLAQLRWYGHIVRMGDERYPQIACQARTHEKTSKGRPRQTWEKDIQKFLTRN